MADCQGRCLTGNIIKVVRASNVSCVGIIAPRHGRIGNEASRSRVTDPPRKARYGRNQIGRTRIVGLRLATRRVLICRGNVTGLAHYQIRRSAGHGAKLEFAVGISCCA